MDLAMEWLSENWVRLVEIAGLVLTVVSLIAGMTPTPKDDEFVKKLLDFFSLIKPKDAPGSVKAPFTRTKK